jgi:hypothetical protein
MGAMSGLHRTVLSQLSGPPQPVFLDTTAGYETNIDAIASKAVEYYEHHLQTKLTVARYRHRNLTAPAEVGAAVAAIRSANLIFAGPGSPSYAIQQWRDSPVWDAVVERFEAGADMLFASAASITLGRYALPVYEIYKAGNDPFWLEGLDLLGRMGLNLAVVPHFDDNSGGENYDSRFCYMGARRFDQLQEALPEDSAIVGIDAYTGITFDPHTQQATVTGQGTITLIAGGDEQRFQSGACLPFDAFRSTERGVVRTYDSGRTFGYEWTDTPSGGAVEDGIASLAALIEGLPSLKSDEKVEILARLEALRQDDAETPGANEGPLVDLVLELREALRAARRFDLADRARQTLEALGFEIGDSPQGSTWTRR